MFRRMNRVGVMQLLGALLLYVMILALYLLAMLLDPGGSWKAVIALAHLLAALCVVFSFLRYFMHLDELQRRMQADALSFALAGTILLVIAYGFLDIIGFPRLSWGYLFPVVVALWFAGTWMADRRYE
jgi:heme/copper-type cytochrome/quinol oxidase subunit 4